MPAFELKERGIDEAYTLLLSLPAELVSKRGGPVKKSLRKGALVLHRAAKANLRARTDTTEDARINTQLLEKSLVVTRGKAPASGKGERYLVRVKRKTYIGRKGKPVTTLKTGQLLEYGSSEQPAEPWLRPAFASHAQQAVATVQTELVRDIAAIQAKLQRGR